MNNENDHPLSELGIVARVNIPEKGLFLTSRTFTCPPGYYYCVFNNTSAGPEFIQNFGPNQQGKLEKDQDIYRVAIGGAPYHYDFKSPFSMIDGTTVDIEFQLKIKVSDGVRVARWVIQDKIDPLNRLARDINNLIDQEISPMEYSKVFLAKTKEIKLSNQGLKGIIKKNIDPDEYGII
ncbi:MAG: hypothetical protein WBW94_00845, partial [Anaerolineales bacterium]